MTATGNGTTGVASMTPAEDALLDKLLLEFEAGLNDVMERRVGCNHRAVCPLCRQQLPCDDPRRDADMWFAHLNQIPVMIRGLEALHKERTEYLAASRPA